ncbi:polyadenylate-binding protein-interacting protein 1 [Caerostris darwini]|uniref:Polyadenylate-binding protein-interacting protein 1 n=1 Tax=Caerostris darwini TaxID=1538125 RepID=A0AAV4W3D3_9ARAC|nr:polyadenylate-binding protein-interacting protein 1 [Caerostris darwini]
MEQNDGTPSGYGRGRPMDNTELRRPHAYSTYANPDYVPTEGTNTNGIYPETSWHPGPPELAALASPSGDHWRSGQNHGVGLDPPGSSFKLSPYAKEFVPRSFRPEPRVIDEGDSYPVEELRSFLNEITLNPGKFERKIQSLTHTLNTMVDDDESMRAIVNIIFDESVRQPNLRYSGARLCKCLCNDLDASPDRLNFRSVLLTRCNQEFKRREALAEAEDNGTYLRGFAMFTAELFSQLEVMKQRVTVLGDSLPNLIKTLLNYASSDNLKCACQVLKMVGASLEDYERGKVCNNGTAPEMDYIILSLKKLANSVDYTRNIKDMINSVIKLRDSNWGRLTPTENSGYETSPPTAVDEPVMYGPDGKPMTADELTFLQSQYASNMASDGDDFDFYEESEEFSDEISEAYEIFLRDHAQPVRH